MGDWVDAIEAVITVCPTTSNWLLNYFSTGKTTFHIPKPNNQDLIFRWTEVPKALPFGELKSRRSAKLFAAA